MGDGTLFAQGIREVMISRACRSAARDHQVHARFV